MNRVRMFLSAAGVSLLFSTTVMAMPMHSLFSDHRAMRVNDILTIHIVESTKANANSATTTAKENEANVGFSGGTGRFRFLPSFGTNNSNRSKFDGTGKTSREGKFEATVSARVIEVLEGGNLVIEGSKVVEVNQEKETLKITGIVRPQDIQKNNIVFSSSIADAEITYSGSGVVNTASRKGIITRMFGWMF